MSLRSAGKQALQHVIEQRGESSANVAEANAHHPVPRPGAHASQSGRRRPLTGAGTGPIDLAQRSSRRGRTMMSGLAILMLSPPAERQGLIAEYVDLVGSWPVSSSLENAALLEFLASRLPEPSHAFSLCRMEVALTRAWLGAETFVEPEYRTVQGRSKRDVQARVEHEAWGCIERAMQGRVETETWDHIERTVRDSVEGAVWDGIAHEARCHVECEAWQILDRSARNRIERGLYASLVWFHAEPETVLRALHGANLPPLTKPAYPILFGPGVPNLCRAATPEEVVLWASLPTDDTAPDLVERLLAEGIVGYTD
jgi:hypothetical protein